MNWLKSQVGQFVLKVIGIYFCWYLIYELWLLPEGSLDAWLTTNIVSVSAGILDYLNYDFFAYERLIGIDETAGIYLADGCSGIAAIGLFIGFVVAYPGEWSSRIAFIFFGVGIIYLVNVARIVTLAITQAYWPKMFGITHDYSTTAIFYMVIFVLWMIWANYGSVDSSQQQVAVNN
ncbi:exosortase X [Fodinibius halophilus]|uniref:Exosortase/archaeosortase family protein n=1 Tax=Fodinibius halophilus TaxID=1736908 RepID=A0A6M1TBE0_9BACT|nr:archaeosortase/exosortase family protein [Fodinibius halophilus]NGP89351.1 exosortase/archaeosortase family protein [Fodinibius halophilus]